MKSKRIAVAIGVLAACSGSAFAQLIVGNDQSAPAIWDVDVTGSRAPKSLLSGSAAVVYGMAYDPTSAQLYWNNGAGLYRAPAGESKLGPSLIGSIRDGARMLNITGLAFRPSTGRLLGFENGPSPRLFDIDPETAVGQFAASCSGFDFGGLDYDATTDAFYGLSDHSSSRGVYRIDPDTFAATRLADYPGTETDIDGLAAGNGRLYLVSDGSRADGGDPIWIFDLASGTYVDTIPSAFTSATGVYAGAAFVPGPGAWALLTMAGIVAVARKR
ncbi:MAG: hypothetical protein JNM07_03885 [Phycisphaerae bacterium]|nr:hypothetical protein [Phycisphaerae bacterium]